MVAAFFLAMLYARHRGLRSLMILIVIWLVAQAALTLSRGGLWAGLGAITVASLFLARDRQMRTVLIFIAIVGFLLLNFVALPALDEFTGDVVTSRLQDFDLTGRDQIMRADWIIFQRNPLFGVGPGQSYNLHDLTFRASAAHNEYTRLLAEHGSLGLAALLILFVLAGRLLTRPQRPFAKGFTFATVTYALLFLFHSAMRLAAPAYLFGLAAVTLVLEPEDDQQADDLT
jgi:O-antigen ligase